MNLLNGKPFFVVLQAKFLSCPYCIILFISSACQPSPAEENSHSSRPMGPLFEAMLECINYHAPTKVLHGYNMEGKS